jgi:CCR4-NOT transcription complex subunit 7/8|tara:strand:+ start:273 stop:449 length:177 start_codon:yes stop_codon:yes gene_type:complete
MSRPPLTNENLLTREVWGTNLDEELSIIREMLEEYPYIAMDTEFPGVVRLENNFSCEV